MSEYTPPRSAEEFKKNFSQIKPRMNETEAYYESSRCLFCYDAPCVNACPTGIDIPLFIRQINSKNTIAAAKTIYDSNYFGYACGKVCPTEVLCEGACVYNLQEVKPIEIGRLQSFATGNAIRNKKNFYSIPPDGTTRVAVIGAGPSGISCACELRKHGIQVDVFEAKKKPSGLTVHGVAPYKITNEEALDEVQYLEEQFGFKIYYESQIADAGDFEKLEKNYHAVFLGIGLGSTSVLRIPGEEQENCFGAVEFVERLRDQQYKVAVPAKVIVLGGGNTAMDAASETARMGASVILAYRRSREEMGAYDFEYDLAKSVGVKGLFNVSPVAITGSGKADGVTFRRTKTVNGKVEEIPGSEFTESCDWVIKATGQSKQVPLLSLVNGLRTDEKGHLIVDSTTFRTTHPKYFAAGDVVSGGEEVVNAVANGKKAAAGILHFLAP